MALLSTDVNAYLTSYGFNPAAISAENKSIINKILAGAATGAYSVAMSELNREMERRRAMGAGTGATGTTNPDVLVSDAIADSDKAAKAKRTRNIMLIVVGALVLIGGAITTVVLIRRNRKKRQRNGQ